MHRGTTGTTGSPVVSGPAREERRGGAIGIAVLAYFSLAWTGWGMSTGVPTAVEVPVIAAAALCSLVLVAGAVRTYRQAAVLPSGELAGRGRSTDRRFGLVVAAEFIGLAVIARILVVTGHSQLIPTMVCLGVGIHFFPLSRLFTVRLYDRTGAALCLVALATAVLAPLTGQAALWTMLPGFGAALTLYATCALLVRGKTMRPRGARSTVLRSWRRPGRWVCPGVRPTPCSSHSPRPTPQHRRQAKSSHRRQTVDEATMRRRQPP